MAAKKTGSKKASKSETSAAPLTTEDIPKTAASKEKDKEEKAPTFRVDLGESLPTPPIRTATDND